MKCEKAQQLISLWLDGMLGNEDEQALWLTLKTADIADKFGGIGNR